MSIAPVLTLTDAGWPTRRRVGPLRGLRAQPFPSGETWTGVSEGGKRPVWSPDGGRELFFTSRAERRTCSDGVRLIDAEGTDVQRFRVCVHEDC